MLPSGSQRARSPVLYSAAGRVERIGDEPLGGQLGLVDVAEGDLHASDVQLAGDRRSGPAASCSSRMWIVVLAIGAPMGTDGAGRRADTASAVTSIAASVGP